MLNAGEVPNTLQVMKKVAICESRPFAKEQFGRAAGDMTPLQLYAYFIQRVKQYLHIILAFSPIGSAFRDRHALFPSLATAAPSTGSRPGRGRAPSRSGEVPQGSQVG